LWTYIRYCLRGPRRFNLLYRVLCLPYCTLINTQYPARGKSINMHYIVIIVKFY
jgi:hypothetical protein